MKYYGFIFLMILFGVILYFPDINFIKMRETFQNLATMNQPLLYDSYRPNYRHNGVSANTYNDICMKKTNAIFFERGWLPHKTNAEIHNRF